MLEPVGSKAPAFAGDQKLSLLVRRANTDVSLPCNAQGHPTPVYRYEETGPFGIETNVSPFSPLLSSVKIEGNPVPGGWKNFNGISLLFTDLVTFCVLCSEPMGIKAPAFLGDVKSFLLVRRSGTKVSMPCNAQGHPVPVTRYHLIENRSGKNLTVCARIRTEYRRFIISSQRYRNIIFKVFQFRERGNEFNWSEKSLIEINDRESNSLISLLMK